MIHCENVQSAKIERQNNISGLNGLGDPVAFLPSPVEQGGRVLYLEVEMSLPYFRFWVDDWMASPNVRTMTLEQRGLYHHLLCLSWQIGPLPKDLKTLAKLAQINPKTLRKLWQNPLKTCFVLTDDHLINERLEIEREWANSKKEKAIKAANVKWAKQNHDADALQTHMQTHPPSICHPDPDPDPDLKKKKEEEQRAMASPPPRRGPVYWDLKPKWKPEHPSLETAQLKVEPAHLEKLAKGFPDVDISAEIRSMKSYAIDNPGWARVKRNWQKTLGGWIRRADERLRDGRFKAKQARASPTAELVALEESWRPNDDDETNKSITACEKEHGSHKDSELLEGSKTRYCKHGCGYYVARKGDENEEQ